MSDKLPVHLVQTTWVDEVRIETDGYGLRVTVEMKRSAAIPSAYHYPQASDVPADVRQALRAWLDTGGRYVPKHGTTQSVNP